MPANIVGRLRRFVTRGTSVTVTRRWVHRRIPRKWTNRGRFLAARTPAIVAIRQPGLAWTTFGETCSSTGGTLGHRPRWQIGVRAWCACALRICPQKHLPAIAARDEAGRLAPVAPSPSRQRGLPSRRLGRPYHGEFVLVERF
ncbi:hypothetical protein CDD83_546 [Cordyceps sp. RAO-2017]|nr:hypothetical protein CDD83_546 [Cordyceps sp. RAO-2017]